MTKPRPLTEQEHDAVLAYALKRGRYWKSSLRTDWLNTRAPGIIQALRNPHGLRWLATYSLKQPRSSSEPGRVISMIAANGDLFEAMRVGADDPWTISYPEGQDRFYGTEREVHAHIRQLMVRGPAAKIAP